jgi:hypothetical protein
MIQTMTVLVMNQLAMTIFVKELYLSEAVMVLVSVMVLGDRIRTIDSATKNLIPYHGVSFSS